MCPPGIRMWHLLSLQGRDRDVAVVIEESLMAFGGAAPPVAIKLVLGISWDYCCCVDQESNDSVHGIDMQLTQLPQQAFKVWKVPRETPKVPEIMLGPWKTCKGSG